MSPNMTVPDRPQHPANAEPDPLDDEWERFQANGCPDWWLLAKYVGQAASRFPYQPFKGMPAVGSPPNMHIDSHAADADMTGQQEQSVELQQHNGKTPALSAAAGSSEQQAPAGTLQQPDSEGPAVSSPRSPAAVPDALSTMPCKPAAGGAAAPACGLKGIFGCAGGSCAYPCTAAQPADQTA